MSNISSYLRLNFSRGPRNRAEKVLATHGQSFHFAGQLLDRQAFQDCARLYSFCRYLDDIVDKASDSKLARQQLDSIEEDLKQGLSYDPIIADFLALARQHQLDLRPAHQLIYGVRGDLDIVETKTEAELKRYCYRVAGCVGLLMCGVLGVQDFRALAHAIDLGIGMQLTNIARDVEEDARAGRRYLPATWIGNLTPNQIVSPNEEVKAVLTSSVERLLAEADRYYLSGEAGLSFLPPRARLAILAASRLYQAIGGVLAALGYATWLGRAIVPRSHKFMIAVQAVADGLVNPRFWHLPRKHDAELHRYLKGLPGVQIIEHQI